MRTIPDELSYIYGKEKPACQQHLMNDNVAAALEGILPGDELILWRR
jgi:hypothetical protein